MTSPTLTFALHRIGWAGLYEHFFFLKLFRSVGYGRNTTQYLEDNIIVSISRRDGVVEILFTVNRLTYIKASEITKVQ